jgi:hypothetical protein
LITSVNSANLNLGSGNWTIEFWINPVTSNQLSTIFNKVNAINGLAPFNFMLINGYISLFMFDTSGSSVVNWSAVAPISINGWSFITAVRVNNTITLYVNGISVISTPIAGNTTLYHDSSIIKIGAYEDNTYAYNGYIDDIRVTKGIGRYRSNFTPPTQPFPTQ